VGYLPKTADRIQGKITLAENQSSVLLDRHHVRPSLRNEVLPAMLSEVRLSPWHQASGSDLVARTRPQAHLPSLKGDAPKLPGHEGGVRPRLERELHGTHGREGTVQMMSAAFSGAARSRGT